MRPSLKIALGLLGHTVPNHEIKIRRMHVPHAKFFDEKVKKILQRCNPENWRDRDSTSVRDSRNKSYDFGWRKEFADVTEFEVI